MSGPGIHSFHSLFKATNPFSSLHSKHTTLNLKRPFTQNRWRKGLFRKHLLQSDDSQVVVLKAKQKQY